MEAELTYSLLPFADSLKKNLLFITQFKPNCISCLFWLLNSAKPDI